MGWSRAAFFMIVTTLHEIHDQIDRLSDRRAELWRALGEARDPDLAAELKELDEQLDELWEQHRLFRATLRFGDRDRIIARARAEERLERAA
jgi:hypothetical protein